MVGVSRCVAIAASTVGRCKRNALEPPAKAKRLDNSEARGLQTTEPATIRTQGGLMRRSMCALLLAALTIPLAAQSPPLEVPYRQFRLANGLTVILHQDKS